MQKQREVRDDHREEIRAHGVEYGKDKLSNSFDTATEKKNCICIEEF
jgi:hypothetical protein